MVKVIYNGDKNPCRIKILNMTIQQWGKGEVKELSDFHWEHLKHNVDFSLVGKQKESPVKEIKKEVVLETKKEIDAFDLDRDGDVDADDYSLAAKTLGHARKQKK